MTSKSKLHSFRLSRFEQWRDCICTMSGKAETSFPNHRFCRFAKLQGIAINNLSDTPRRVKRQDIWNRFFGTFTTPFSAVWFSFFPMKKKKTLFEKKERRAFPFFALKNKR